MASHRRRALPDRRQLARLPGVLRAARVDRDVDGLSDERDLRLRVDAREDPHRARHEADGRRVGRGLERAQGGLRRVQGHAHERGRTCSREQWPHFEPLVEAFGYTNIARRGLRGRRRHRDARRARARAGDPGRRSSPATATRSSSSTPRASSRSWRRRAGSPRRSSTTTRPSSTATASRRSSIPDFYGLKGDTSDNIPGVPGIGDKTAAHAAAALRRPRGRARARSTRSPAPSARRTSPTTPTTRASRRSSRRSSRDVPVDARRRGRGRARARPLEAARGLPRVRAARPAAPPGGVPRRRGRGRARAGGRDDGRRAACARARSPTSRGCRTASSRSPSRAPRGRRRASCSRVEADAGASRAASATRCSPATLDDPAERRRARVGDRPVVAHDAKSLGVVPPNLVHDTLLGAYLLEPARRGFPLRELLEERGLAADARGRGRAPRRVLVRELAAWQREQIADARPDRRCMDEIELPLVPRPARDGGRRRAAGHRAPGARSRRACATRSATSSARSGSSRARSSSIGSPQQLGEILFNKLGLSKKRRGKTGFSTDARVLQAIRDEHEIIPKIERWRELNQLDEDVPRRPAAARPTRASRASTRRSCRPPRRPAGSRRRTRTCRTSRSARRSGREIRGCFEAAPGNVLLSADYSQVELRVLAHIADEPVLKEIFVRGEDVHTATASTGLRQGARRARPVGQRSKAKMINYGIVYGLSDYGLADRLGIPREEAKAFIDAYLERFPRGRARSSRRRSSRRRTTATSRRCGAAGARSPSSRRATGRCARSASASRSTPSSRAPRRTS